MQTQPTPKILKKYYSGYIGQRRLINQTKMQQRSLPYENDKLILQQYAEEWRLLDIVCNGGFFLDCLDNTFEKHGIEFDTTDEHCL
jgi:hypothetical protein